MQSPWNQFIHRKIMLFCVFLLMLFTGNSTLVFCVKFLSRNKYLFFFARGFWMSQSWALTIYKIQYKIIPAVFIALSKRELCAKCAVYFQYCSYMITVTDENFRSKGDIFIPSASDKQCNYCSVPTVHQKVQCIGSNSWIPGILRFRVVQIFHARGQ